MNGRAPSAQIIIVHAREIVVHERIRVYHLDGGGEPRCVARTSRRTIGGEEQNPTKAFSAAEQAVTHGLSDARCVDVKRRQLVLAYVRERLIDLTATGLDFDYDILVERGDVPALSHENP
jgi:hypothetical protein